MNTVRYPGWAWLQISINNATVMVEDSVKRKRYYFNKTKLQRRRRWRGGGGDENTIVPCTGTLAQRDNIISGVLQKCELLNFYLPGTIETRFRV